MASKSKGKSLLFEAFSHSSDNHNDKVNIYEYEVFSDSQQLIPSNKKITVFRDFFPIGPRFTIILINIVLVIFLIAIGYGISIGISSATPKQHGDFCNLTSECSQSDHYVCSENKCKCPTGMFYTTTCVKQFGHMSACTFKNKDECGYGLYCLYDSSGLSKCLCSNERYWNTETNYCDLRIEFDQTGCTDVSQCQTNKNLVCQASKCTCVYPYFWNGTYCNLKSSYLQICSIELGCDETKLLNCTLNGDYIYRCECDYTRFWSTVSETCTLRYLNAISCNTSEECRTDLGLQCATAAGSKECQCDSNYYWSGTECLIKKNNAETCSVSVPCNENQGLICNVATCECPTNYFHDGTRCQYYINTGLNCNPPYVCDSTLGLTCHLATLQCVCAVTHFWNYTLCVPKFLNGSSCINDIQCDTAKFLSCDSSNDQCLCDFDKYWDSSAPICTLKLPLNSACTETYQCRDYLGLECSTTCICPADYYWDGTKCSPQLSYYETCANSGHEPCLQSKGLQCSTTKCRCSDIQKYWNYVECVPKILHGENCIYQRITFENNQCADYSPYSLICLATPYVANSWSCQCRTTQYYDSVSGQCVNRITFRGTCTVSSQCQDYFGLICYSNSTCLCPSTQYWNSAESRCREKLAYNQPCTYTNDGTNESCQDYAFLFCISSACRCIASRYYDTDFAACLPRSSHNQRCTASGQCMTSTPYTLTCLSGTCQCHNFNNEPNSGTQVYWSVTDKNCLACPTGYSSGWGSGVYNSPNRITNRCYKIVKSNSYTYDSAQTNCQNALISGRRANLITIRNIMELNMVKTQFWQSGFNFVVGSKTSTPLVFTWNFDGGKAVQNTFYCLNQPNNAGSNQLVLVFQSSYCLDDLANTASYSFICEFG